MYNINNKFSSGKTTARSIYTQRQTFLLPITSSSDMHIQKFHKGNHALLTHMKSYEYNVSSLNDVATIVRHSFQQLTITLYCRLLDCQTHS